MTQPSSGMVYDPGFPFGVSAPAQRVQTQPDNIGSSEWNPVRADVDITRYVNQTVGGETGTVIRNGFTSGLNRSWFGAAFTGRSRRFPKADVRHSGPVGRDNSASVRQAGVAEQFTVGPSLEDIYRSFVRTS